MRNLRRDATQIFHAGVDAVRGDRLLRQGVRLDDQQLWLGGIGTASDSFDRLIVVGAGKASGSMAVGLVQALQASLIADELGPVEITGQINVPSGNEFVPTRLSWPPGLALFPARPVAINEPTAAAIAGTDRILQYVAHAGSRDLVIVLLSGGGSALLCRPIAGVTLDEKLAVIRHLSGSGADITELNTVRKHLSEVKGGGLARAVGEAAMVTLVLSDVISDPLDLIASGPTVRDRSTPTDALRVLAQYDPDRRLPNSVYRVLSRPRDVQTSAVHQREFPIAVLGNNDTAVSAAGIAAESLRYDLAMESSRPGEGFAEVVGEHIAERTLAQLRRDRSSRKPQALITGGEPVVRLANVSIRGRGGRNQQLVLAAYGRLLNENLTDHQWQRLMILSGGTDGEDGPTDAAGAFINVDVHRRATELKLSPSDFLNRNDAYEFFARTGGLLITGPTGTNVCDVRVALVN